MHRFKDVNEMFKQLQEEKFVIQITGRNLHECVSNNIYISHSLCSTFKKGRVQKIIIIVYI